MEFIKQFQNTATQNEYDDGLRRYMTKVYNYMSGALTVTAISALFVSSSPILLNLIFGTPLHWVLTFAPIVFVFVLSAKIETMKFETMQVCFWAFSVLMGCSLSGIFLVYTHSSIAKVFFITSILFGGMSIYGNVTHRDLTNMGSFLIMGVWGIVIASIINLFFKSSGLHFALSLISVLIFTGLTAYDAQRLKSVYYLNNGNHEIGNKISLMGALGLYFNFINIFINLLHLIGDRRN